MGNNCAKFHLNPTINKKSYGPEVILKNKKLTVTVISDPRSQFLQVIHLLDMRTTMPNSIAIRPLAAKVWPRMNKELDQQKHRVILLGSIRGNKKDNGHKRRDDPSLSAELNLVQMTNPSITI